MKHLFTLVSLFLVGLVVQAQTVTLETAQERASSFLKTHRTHANAVQAKTPNLTLAHRATDATGSEVYYYVFNNEAGGFVIVGGDDAAEEILGYSSEGSFDDKTLPPNFRWWLSVYSNQIASAIHAVKDGSLDLRAAKASRAKRKASRIDIPNLLTHEGEEICWNQSKPFSCLIPFGQDPDPVVTGCVATAFAQLMYKYEHPKYPYTGIGSYSYPHNVYDDNTKTSYKSATFSADFTTPIDWSSMKPKYDYAWTGNGSEMAVASLMYKIGVAAEMDYQRQSTGGSGTDTKKAGAALVNNFKYDKSIRTDAREYFTDEQWESLIYNELNEGRPLIYSGKSTTSGHAFVCSGYQTSTNKFYINWGWGGSYNGYFLLTPTLTDKALTPNGTGIGGGSPSSSYVESQRVVYRVMPEAGGMVAISGCANDIVLDKVVAQPGEGVSVTSGIINGGMFTVDMSIGVRLENTADPGDVTYVASPTWETASAGNKRIYNFNVPTTFKPGKSYYVSPAYKDENDTWQVAKVPSTVVRPTLTVQAPNYLFSFGLYALSATSAKLGTSVSTTYAELRNLRDISVTKVPVGLMFINTTDPSDNASSQAKTITLPQYSWYSSINLAANVPASLTPGQSYKVVPAFMDMDGIWKVFELDGGQTDQILAITAPDNIMVSEPLKVTNGGYVTKDNLNVSFKLANKTGAAKTIPLGVYIFPAGGGSSVGHFKSSSVTLVNGEERSFSFSHADLEGTPTFTVGADYSVFAYDLSTGDLLPGAGNGHKYYVRPALPINYTLTGAGWGTICLPYEAAVPAGLTAYEVTNVISDVLQTAEVAKLEMNKPYLLKGTPDTYNFNGPTTPEGTWNNGCLVGNTQTAVTYAPADSYVLQNNPSLDGLAFYRVQADNTQKVKQYSAYLNVPAVVTSIFLPESDEVTAVESIPTVQAPSGIYYNIMGQQVRPGTKGIVISNGKKYLNK